jgi:uncharacterized protein YbaP (TraB family)
MPQEDRLRLEATAGIIPYPEGLLWRATKDDTTLTLFGTYHLAHSQTVAHAAALLPLARAADFSFFEMNAADKNELQRTMTRDPSLMFTLTGPTLPDSLSEADWQRLRAAMANRGFPTAFAAKAKPIFVSMMLGMSPCQLKNQASGAKGIDETLATTLDQAGLDTRSLEDPLTAFKAFDRFSHDEQVAMVRLSLDLPLDPDDLQATMRALYRDGRIAMLWQYGRWLSIKYGGATATEDFARMEQALLDERNVNWIDTITKQATGETVFIAVGAAHLPGKAGLLNLLAKRGFAITPLPFAP